jgi:hypothetical protein
VLVWGLGRQHWRGNSWAIRVAREAAGIDVLVNEGLKALQRNIETDAIERYALAHPHVSFLPATWQDLARNRLGVCFGFLNHKPPFIHTAEIWDFASIDDLNKSLVASCAVPGFSTLPRYTPSPAQRSLDTDPATLNRVPKVKDDQHPIMIDGGIPNLQPHAGEVGVLCVSPFWWYWNAHIRPQYIPSGWSVWPPGPDQYMAIYSFGYLDAVTYLRREGLITQTQSAALLAECPAATDPDVQALRPTPIPHWSQMALSSVATFYSGRYAWRRFWRRGK